MRFMKYVLLILTFSFLIFSDNDSLQSLIDSLRSENSGQNVLDSKSKSGIDFTYEENEIDSSEDFEDYTKKVDSKTIDEDVEVDSLKSLESEYDELQDSKEFVKRIEGDSSEVTRFGASYIKSLSKLDNQYGPVDPGYSIGLGDEIVVLIWGDVESTISVKVNRIGTIDLKGIGQVPVAGLTLAEVKSKLIKRYSRVYSGVKNGSRYATTFVDVSLGQLRGKRVSIVGDVKNPGMYIVPSLVGVYGALSYAGGISENGSVREIYLRRNKKNIDTLDLYSYLLNREVSNKNSLSDFDVIIVPPIKKSVTIEGAVHRPAIYELKENEKFTDLLHFAGGLLPEAYRGNCNISRTVEGEERKTITYALSDSTTINMFKNDHVKIGFIDEIDNTVKIEGAIKRPGNYSCEDSLTLKELLDLAGGMKEDFFPDRAEILRTYEDFEKEVISVNIGDLLNGIVSENIVLQKWDIVKVYSKWDIKNRHYVTIKGNVKNPGKYFLRDSMRVQDLILLAGGFTEMAYKDSVELSRIIDSHKMRGNQTEARKIAVGEDFYKNDSEFLQHMDNVFVRTNSSLAEQEIITLSGEFAYPGHYAKKSDNETLYSLIQRSGGMKKSAYVDGAMFIRRKDSIGVVAIDLPNLLKHGSTKDDIILEDGDSLYIPTRPKTVIVEGSVHYPAAVKFEEGKSIGHYIKRSGGLTGDADKRSILVVLANGEVRKVRRMSKEVNAGSKIVVAKKIEKERSVNVLGMTQAIIGIMTSAVSLAILAEKL